MVSITLRVMSRPDVQHLPKIYQNLGLDYDERVLPSIGNEVLKSIVAQFDAAELITQREVVSSALCDGVQLLIPPGIVTHSCRLVAACGRVPYPTRGCLHHPLDFRQGMCCTLAA